MGSMLPEEGGSKQAPDVGAGGPRRLWLVAVVVVLAAAGMWLTTSRRAAAPAPAPAVGEGRWALLEFGMGLCEQCKKMKPVMEEMGRVYGERLDVRVLDIRQEANEALAKRYGLRVIPLVLLADGTGAEVWRHEGFIPFAELSGAVGQRLAQPPPADPP